MINSELLLSPSVWLAPVSALAVVGMGAALLLLRDHLRLERHTLSLAAQVERLQGEIRAFATSRAAEPEAGRPSDQETPAASPAPVSKPGPEPVLANPSRVGPKRVLLAEDDEVNALLAVKSLERVGATIDWAKDGVEAVALAEESFAGERPAYDLVLMDLRMPRLGGLDATRRIRQLEAASARPEPLRIVALTATTMRQDRLDAEQAGMNHFLSKPYDATALAQLLDQRGDRRARAS